MAFLTCTSKRTTSSKDPFPERLAITAAHSVVYRYQRQEHNPILADLSAASIKQQSLPAVNTSRYHRPTLAGPDTADRLRAMFGNLRGWFATGGGSGLIAGLFDAAKGAQTGIRTDPTGIALQNQRANLIAAHSIFTKRELPPEQAISLGILGANNPKIMEEQLARYKNMEEKIANTPSGPGGNQDAMQQYNEFKKQQAANEALGKSQGGQLANIENSKAILDQSLSQIDTIKKHPGLEWQSVHLRAALQQSPETKRLL